MYILQTLCNVNLDNLPQNGGRVDSIVILADKTTFRQAT